MRDPLDHALAPGACSDLLSDVLALLQVESSTLGLFELREQWGFRLDRLPFPAGWIVIEGKVWIRAPDGSETTLDKGDMFVLPRGVRDRAFILGSSPEVEPVPLDDLWRHAELEGFRPGETTRRAQYLRWGGTGPATRVAATAFSYKSSQPEILSASLPELIVARSSEIHGQSAVLESLLQFALSGAQPVQPGFATLAVQIAQLLLVLAVRAHALSLDSHSVGVFASALDPQIGRALSLIHRRPRERWTVAALARAAGLSRTVFAARFVAAVGEPPMRYLRTWRMRLAREALGSGRVPVGPLAHELGYASEAAFRSAFRRTVGQAPSEFRGGPDGARPARS